jgi:hypothetical protein
MRDLAKSLLFVSLLAPSACESGEKSDGSTDTTTAGDPPREDIADDERCMACLQPSDGIRAEYSCGAGEIDCGVVYPPTALGAPPIDVCESYEEPPEDCTPLSEHNAGILACVGEQLASGEPFVVRRSRNEYITMTYDREFHFRGDGTAFDIDDDFEDLSVTWSGTELRTVPVADVTACLEMDDVDAAWSCIETAFDSTEVLVQCTEAGWYEDNV